MIDPTAITVFLPQRSGAKHRIVRQPDDLLTKTIEAVNAELAERDRQIAELRQMIGSLQCSCPCTGRGLP